MISNLNPMFENQKQRNNQASYVRKKPSGHRQTRSDKKHDIRVPVSQKQKQTIHAMKISSSVNSHSDVSMTNIATSLVKQGIERRYPTQPIPYVNYDEVVHVKLPNDQYRDLLLMCNEWNYTSARRGAHRILIAMLNQANGGVIIEGI